MLGGRGALRRPRRTDLGGSSVSLRAITSLALGLGALLALAGGDAAAAPAPAPLLELFVHPANGGGWSAQPIAVRLAGTASPSVAAGHGMLALVGVGLTGDVSVSIGTLSGAFATVDLAAVGAPPAVGRPAVWVSARGIVEVWYRTATGDLEVASRTAAGTWSALDVTAAIHAPSLAGDPSVAASSPTAATAYAVTSTGAVVSFADPAGTPTGWSATTPTSGVAAPPLSGTVDALAAPGMPGATVLLGTTTAGDVVEESDEVAGPPVGVGKWHATDLTATGHVPAAAGDLPPTTSSEPGVAYRTWSGDVVALTLSTGLPGGTVPTDLTSSWSAYPAQGAVPELVVGPLGPVVAIRSITGDVLLMSVDEPTRRRRRVVPAPHRRARRLRRRRHGGRRGGRARRRSAEPDRPDGPAGRIVLLATSFDQEHRRLPDDAGRLGLQPVHRDVRSGLVGRVPSRRRGRGMVLGLRRVGLARLRRPDEDHRRVVGLVRHLGSAAPPGPARDALHAGVGDAIVWGSARRSMGPTSRSSSRCRAATSTSSRGTRAATSPGLAWGVAVGSVRRAAPPS